MPAISVVIPVYNVAPFLREALDSLLAQTCGDFEAIAVNDGSTDNSLEILQDYAARDSRIRILDGPNGGYGKAMNRGMDAATGKYMAILEPDDYLPREAYAVLLPLAEQHRLDVVRGTYCTFYEEKGKRIIEYYRPTIEAGRIFTPSREGNALETAAVTWTSLYRLDFLRKNRVRYNESPGASYQDNGLYFFSMAFAYRFMQIEDPVYAYRVDNATSSINSMGRKRYSMMDEYDYIMRRLEQTSVWHDVKMRIAECAMKSQEWICCGLSANEQEEWFVRLMQWADILQQRGLLSASREEQLRRMREARSLKEKISLFIPFKLQEGETRFAKVVRQYRFWGISVCKKEMSADNTTIFLFGIPVLRRIRMGRLRCFNTGIRALDGIKNVYYVLGIPIAARISAN